MISNSYKRAQRHSSIAKAEEIVGKDYVFGTVIWANLDKVARILEDQLLVDKEFESICPNLCVDF
jgi:hypothetical protein